MVQRVVSRVRDPNEKLILHIETLEFAWHFQGELTIHTYTTLGMWDLDARIGFAAIVAHVSGVPTAMLMSELQVGEVI